MGHAPSIDAEEQEGVITTSPATKEAPEKPSKSSKEHCFFNFFFRKIFSFFSGQLCIMLEMYSSQALFSLNLVGLKTKES